MPRPQGGRSTIIPNSADNPPAIPLSEVNRVMMLGRDGGGLPTVLSSKRGSAALGEEPTIGRSATGIVSPSERLRTETTKKSASVMSAEQTQRRGGDSLSSSEPKSWAVGNESSVGAHTTLTRTSRESSAEVAPQAGSRNLISEGIGRRTAGGGGAVPGTEVPAHVEPLRGEKVSSSAGDTGRRDVSGLAAHEGQTGDTVHTVKASLGSGVHSSGDETSAAAKSGMGSSSAQSKTDFARVTTESGSASGPRPSANPRDTTEGAPSSLSGPRSGDSIASSSSKIPGTKTSNSVGVSGQQVSNATESGLAHMKSSKHEGSQPEADEPKLEVNDGLIESHHRNLQSEALRKDGSISSPETYGDAKRLSGRMDQPDGLRASRNFAEHEPPRTAGVGSRNEVRTSQSSKSDHPAKVDETASPHRVDSDVHGERVSKPKNYAVGEGAPGSGGERSQRGEAGSHSDGSGQVGQSGAGRTGHSLFEQNSHRNDLSSNEGRRGLNQKFMPEGVSGNLPDGKSKNDEHSAHRGEGVKPDNLAGKHETRSGIPDANSAQTNRKEPPHLGQSDAQAEGKHSSKANSDGKGAGLCQREPSHSAGHETAESDGKSILGEHGHSSDESNRGQHRGDDSPKSKTEGPRAQQPDGGIRDDRPNQQKADQASKHTEDVKPDTERSPEHGNGKSDGRVNAGKSDASSRGERIGTKPDECSTKHGENSGHKHSEGDQGEIEDSSSTRGESGIRKEPEPGYKSEYIPPESGSQKGPTSKLISDFDGVDQKESGIIDTCDGVKNDAASGSQENSKGTEAQSSPTGDKTIGADKGADGSRSANGGDAPGAVKGETANVDTPRLDGNLEPESVQSPIGGDTRSGEPITAGSGRKGTGGAGWTSSATADGTNNVEDAGTSSKDSKGRGSKSVGKGDSIEGNLILGDGRRATLIPDAIRGGKRAADELINRVIGKRTIRQSGQDTQAEKGGSLRGERRVRSEQSDAGSQKGGRVRKLKTGDQVQSTRVGEKARGNAVDSERTGDPRTEKGTKRPSKSTGLSTTAGGGKDVRDQGAKSGQGRLGPGLGLSGTPLDVIKSRLEEARNKIKKVASGKGKGAAPVDGKDNGQSGLKEGDAQRKAKQATEGSSKGEGAKKSGDARDAASMNSEKRLLDASNEVKGENRTKQEKGQTQLTEISGQGKHIEPGIKTERVHEGVNLPERDTKVNPVERQEKGSDADTGSKATAVETGRGSDGLVGIGIGVTLTLSDAGVRPPGKRGAGVKGTGGASEEQGLQENKSKKSGKVSGAETIRTVKEQGKQSNTVRLEAKTTFLPNSRRGSETVGSDERRSTRIQDGKRRGVDTKVIGRAGRITKKFTASGGESADV
ncbi:MAG: hypothetical protein K2Z81_13440, partial [Cyanobacteria bacterium]|nr:hypothetical protein [Cyanobacteriota bacterium]